MNSTPPNSPSNDASPAPIPPPRVPDHELIRRIGRGAYGEVWIARSVTGAFRAVKIVHRRSFDHDRPFEREFEGILKFEPISREHDSQVDILHVGRGDDCFYYVMELADDQATGGQIHPDSYAPRTIKSDLMFHGRLPFEECVRIGLSLTTALEHLHAHGLVHRDVKPSNIIFVNGVPKLADIGLVTGIDATRSYVGTEGFAAPEGPGSPQGDLFSLGKVLYEMATGKDRQEFPELPTQLRELPDRDGLMELNAVIARACRHDPKDRYGSAAAMRADLELLQSGKSLARLHRTEAQLRFVRRAGALVTALAALVAAGWLWQARQTHLLHELAGEKAKLADENRAHIARLDKANGMQQMESGDLGGALVWFADGLRNDTNDSAQTEMSRFRLSSLLQLHPKPMGIIDAGSRTNLVSRNFSFDHDGRRMLLAQDHRVELWDLLASPPQRLAAVPDAMNWERFIIRPDGRGFAVSSARRETETWLIEGSNRCKVVTLPAGPLRHVRFSADSQSILGVTSNDVLVRLEAATGKVVGQVARFEMRPQKLLISMDGQRAAVLMTNRQVRVLDLSSGKVVGAFALGVEDEMNVFDAHGRFVVTTLKSGRTHRSTYQARIWDVEAAQIVGRHLTHTDLIMVLKGSPDGRLLVTGSSDRTARLWNQFTGDPVGPPIEHSETVVSAAFSPDSSRVVTADRGGKVLVTDIVTGRRLMCPLVHAGLADAEFALGGAMLVTMWTDGLVRLWSLMGREADQGATPVETGVESVRFSPDGAALLLKKAGEYQLRASHDGKVIGSMERPWAGVYTHSVFSPDGHYLAIGASSNSVRIWDVSTGQPARPALDLGNELARVVAFSPDGRILASAGEGGLVRLWDWREGREYTAPLLQTGAIFSVIFSPQGNRLLATGIRNDKYRGWLWDLEHQTLVREFKQGPAYAGPIEPSFNPSGDRFVAGTSLALEVMVCDARTGEAIANPLWHDNTVKTAVFSPDGRQILTASYDGKARLWDAATGRLFCPPMEHGRDLASASFAADGSMVATLTLDNTLMLWDASSGLALTPPRATPVGSVAFQPHGCKMALTTFLGGRLTLENLRSSLPAAVMEPLAQLAAGRALSGGTTVQPLSLEALEELDQKLRAICLERFAITADQLQRWHLEQVGSGIHLSQIEAEVYHLDQALALKPTPSEAQERRAKLAARLPLPRDPSTPKNLLDLTDLYDHSIASFATPEITGLPQGRQSLAGTEFDIRGVVALSSPPVRGLQGRVSGRSELGFIRVAQLCRQLHFLQATMGEESREFEREEVARVVIHYADGSQRAQPMVYGRHLRRWLSPEGVPAQASEAVIAWEGFWGDAKGTKGTAHFYRTSWTNPTPDLPITHLEYRYGVWPTARPILLAITVE